MGRDRLRRVRQPETDMTYIDHTVYPDVMPPVALDTDDQKADYVERLCAAWDFDIVPDRETFALLRGWKPIFDRYRLPHSPAYHVFRRRFGWEDVPFPRRAVHRPLAYQVLDRREGRDPDPFERVV